MEGTRLLAALQQVRNAGKGRLVASLARGLTPINIQANNINAFVAKPINGTSLGDENQTIYHKAIVLGMPWAKNLHATQTFPSTGCHFMKHYLFVYLGTYCTHGGWLGGVGGINRLSAHKVGPPH